jgi:hypothetical protein
LGKYRYAVVREIPERSAASSTRGVNPSARRLRVASTSACLVRDFCCRRPVVSYGTDITIMVL